MFDRERRNMGRGSGKLGEKKRNKLEIEDVLKPETSLIYGECPVVLKCRSRKNAIVTIFGNSGHVAGKIVGFGAEKVILVRLCREEGSCFNHSRLQRP